MKRIQKDIREEEGNVAKKTTESEKELVKEAKEDDKEKRKIEEEESLEEQKIEKEAEIDVLVLGCTHYPLLKPVLAQVMGKGVGLVDSAESVASQVKTSLQAKDLQTDSVAVEPELNSTFYLTDCSPHFLQLGERILGFPLNHTEFVDIG